MPVEERIGLERWRHVVKLDPDKPMAPALIRRIAGSGTDAIMIGGTQRITRVKVMRLLWHLRKAPVPVVIEVSDEACAIPGADAYFVPVVLNAGHPDWLIHRHLRGLRRLGALVPWHQVLVEGYVIGNPGSAVARLTQACPPAGSGELRALVEYGAGLLRLPIIYLEYSGQLAGPGPVGRVYSTLLRLRKQGATTSRLFYGGGISDFQSALAMSRQVDTIVVGNALYQPRALEILEATLQAVADTQEREATPSCQS